MKFEICFHNKIEIEFVFILIEIEFVFILNEIETEICFHYKIEIEIEFVFILNEIEFVFILNEMEICFGNESEMCAIVYHDPLRMNE